MDKAKLVGALANAIPQNLAEDLVTDFLQLRQDVATATALAAGYIPSRRAAQIDPIQTLRYD